MFPLPLPLELKAGAALLAVAVLLSGYGVWAHKLRAEGAAQCEAAHSRADAAETQRREAARQENDRETTRLANLDRAHAVDLAVASVGLRNAGAAAIRQLEHPTAAASSASAASAPSVPAIVSGEVEERLRALAGSLDESRTAGLACERAYDSLSHP